MNGRKYRRRERILLGVLFMLVIMIGMTGAVYATEYDATDRNVITETSINLDPGDRITNIHDVAVSIEGYRPGYGRIVPGTFTGCNVVYVNATDPYELVIERTDGSVASTTPKRPDQVWTVYRFQSTSGNDNYIQFIPVDYEHNFSYSADGASITATCDGSDYSDCIYKSNGITISLVAAENLVYSGTEKNATISGYPVDPLKNLEAKPTITYYASTGANSTTRSNNTAISPKNVGHYVAEMTWGGKTAKLAFSITKAPLTITAIDRIITYGDDPTNYDGVRYSGFMGGETASVLSGTLRYTYSYSQYDDVGDNYTITPEGLESNNYSITFVPGKMSVKQKAVGLSWGSTELTYNGTQQAPEATATGTVNGDQIGVTVTGKQTNVNSDTTPYYTATASGLTGTKAGNYKLPSTDANKQTNFTIAKAPLTITANDQSCTYSGSAQGENNQTYTTGLDSKVTVADLKGSDSLTSIKLNGQETNAGTYNGKIVPSDAEIGTATDNYTITYVAGKLTIDPKVVDNPAITLSQDSYTYDGEAKKPSVTSVKDGETTIDPTEYTVGYANNKDAALSTDDPAPTVTITDNPDGNYTVSGSKTFTINKATPEYTLPTGLTATYGQTLENVSLPTGWAWEDKTTSVGNVGKNRFSAIFTPTDTKNYNTAKEDLEVTVYEKALTITGATAADRDYIKDNTSVDISAVTFDGGSLTLGEDYTVTGTMNDDTAGDNKDVAVTVTLINTNYSLAAPTTTTKVTINKIDHDPDPVSAAGSAKYGNSGSVALSALIEAGGTIGALTVMDANGILSMAPTVDADNNLTFEFANNEANTGKTAAVTVPITGATNYNDYDIKVTLTVEDKLVPTLAADNITKTYDGEAVTEDQISGTATYSDAAVDGTWAFKTGQGLTNVADSGAKYVVFTPTDTDNYKSAETTLTLTVNPRSVTVKADDKTMTAGETEPEPTATVTGLVEGESQDLITYTLSREPGSGAGTYIITPTGDTTQGNYAVTYETGTLTINARPSGGDSTPTQGDPSEIRATDKVTSATDGVNPLIQGEDFTLQDGGAVFSDAYLSSFEGKRIVTIVIGDKYYEFEVTGTMVTPETVSKLIDALPDAGKITLDDAKAVEAARTAYDKLTEEQKALVPAATCKKLTDAEEAVAALQFEADAKTAQGITTKVFKVKNVKGRKAKVTWEEASDNTGYIIQYSTRKNFKKALKKVVADPAKTKAKVKKLKKGTTYFFRVCAYTEVTNRVTGESLNVNGQWSNVMKARIKK